MMMEERGMLLRQGKCFCCKKTGHMAKDCPPEQGESSKKKADLARFAYTTIKVLTKEQRESFTKMVMEDKDGEDFWNGEPVWRRLLLPYLLNMYK
jgi:Zinc knuckle